MNTPKHLPITMLAQTLSDILFGIYIRKYLLLVLTLYLLSCNTLYIFDIVVGVKLLVHREHLVL